MTTKKNENNDTALEAKDTNVALANVPKALQPAFSANIQELINENLGAGQTLSMSDLKRVKIPSGGATQFEILNTTAGEADYSKHIDGVIIGHKLAKAFWAKSFGDSGGGTPPDCRSDDMKTAIGSPNSFINEKEKTLISSGKASMVQQDIDGAWLCETCHHNQFGTALQTEGKACKDLRFMFFFSKDSLLPQVLVAPPTSLKMMKDYFLGLVNDGLLYHQVITRFSLRKEKSKSGIEYAVLVPSLLEVLDENASKQARVFNKMFEPMLGTMANKIIDEVETDYNDTYV